MNNINSLIEDCKKNNRKAQNQLYGLFYCDLMRVVRKYRKNDDDAAALVNDAFYKVFTSIQHYKPEIPFEIWIKRITINTVIDDFRKNKKHSSVISLDEYENTDVLEYDKDIEEVDNLSANDILKAIEQLAEEEKMVFNLFEIEGYTHNEIAKELAVSERTSKRYLASAKQNLRKMLSRIFETINLILL